jgi:hypothetical protein
MNNKYYVPNITEFYVGYEFEVQASQNSQEWFKTKIEDNWKIGKESYIKLNNDRPIRTKYLEGEDIRGLGFVNHYIKLKKFNTELHKIGYLKKTNGSLFIIEHFLFNKSIKIYKESEYVKDGFEETEIKILYQGKCKSINELKTILKFLEIQ